MNIERLKCERLHNDKTTFCFLNSPLSFFLWLSPNSANRLGNMSGAVHEIIRILIKDGNDDFIIYLLTF